jgi:hypothetical protein
MNSTQSYRAESADFTDSKMSGIGPELEKLQAAKHNDGKRRQVGLLYTNGHSDRWPYGAPEE